MIDSFIQINAGCNDAPQIREFRTISECNNSHVLLLNLKKRTQLLKTMITKTKTHKTACVSVNAAVLDNLKVFAGKRRRQRQSGLGIDCFFEEKKPN